LGGPKTPGFFGVLFWVPSGEGEGRRLRNKPGGNGRIRPINRAKKGIGRKRITHNNLLAEEKKEEGLTPLRQVPKKKKKKKKKKGGSIYCFLPRNKRRHSDLAEEEENPPSHCQP